MIEQTLERGGKIFARRIVDGEVMQASRARDGGRPVLDLPGVEADVVVVAAGREEGCAPEVGEQVEAQVVAIEADSAVQVSDLEVDVSDACLGRDGCIRHGGFLLSYPFH